MIHARFIISILPVDDVLRTPWGFAILRKDARQYWGLWHRYVVKVKGNFRNGPGQAVEPKLGRSGGPVGRGGDDCHPNLFPLDRGVSDKEDIGSVIRVNDLETIFEKIEVDLVEFEWAADEWTGR